MSLARNALLARPQWQMINQLTLPLITVTDTKQSVAGLITVAIPLTLFLDTVFETKGDRPKSRYLIDAWFQLLQSLMKFKQERGTRTIPNLQNDRRRLTNNRNRW